MDEDLTLFAEQRALALALTYSRYLAPRRLLAQVLEAEQPTVDKLIGQDRMVPCFGQSFAGSRDAACGVCQVQACCLVRTTAAVLDETQALVGTAPKSVAEVLDVPLQAVTLMQGLKEALGQTDPQDNLNEPALRFGHGRRPVVDMAQYRLPPKRPLIATVAAAMLGAQAAETAWPPLPETASYRLGFALKDTHVIQMLRTVPQRLSYGSPVWRGRVKADRKRNPEITWLPEGTILRRIYKGELIDMIVYQDRLVWRDQSFATLYEVMAAAMGRNEYQMNARRNKPQGHGTRAQPSTSAARFFRKPLLAIHVRAQALIHAERHHPDKPGLVGRQAFVVCPVCDACLAEGGGVANLKAGAA